MRNNKSIVDRVCRSCDEPKKAEQFQYSYSKDCKRCDNAKAETARNVSNVPDLSFQQRAIALWG